MTTTTALAQPASPLKRITNVAKLHFANPWTTLGLPWIILGVIFVGMLTVWWLIYSAIDESARESALEGTQFSGSSFFIYIYMMVVAIQAISITFPFALGYGVTRRDYYLGSALAFVALAVIYTAGLTIISVAETMTGGWGMGVTIFAPVYFGAGIVERIFVQFVAFLFFLFFGSAIAAVWVRWKATGVTMFFIVVAALLVGLIALATFTDSWVAIGATLVDLGVTGVAAWSLVLTAISGVAGFTLLRRATPRNAA
ncbi:MULTISPECIES: ABC transporter permease [unclassified Salinibacterium]|uniref:ABC transporter permease n=1 Tax=unclassified Salinibacterium TaxID=2632331 RepID=UPI0010094178|nr:MULTISPECIES: ABC transporter permease [unclassified Salinibacterium]MBH0084572.1 ABC transporter permease [Salinibacterium sp. SWN167]QAV69147.1 ABC transporter permease [Salinibacterium sp. UTAS2018]